MDIAIIKIRLSHDHLIFTMGICITKETVFIIKTASTKMNCARKLDILDCASCWVYCVISMLGASSVFMSCWLIWKLCGWSWVLLLPSTLLWLSFLEWLKLLTLGDLVVPYGVIDHYRKISNIRCTKIQNLNVSGIGLQLSLRNILKPSVKWKMKM